MRKVFHIFLILVAEIIDVLSLSKDQKKIPPDIYKNIKNITLSLIDEHP